MDQLKSGHLHILLTSDNDDVQNQIKVILCSPVMVCLDFYVLLLQHKAEMKIKPVEFPDQTGDKYLYNGDKYG